MKSVFRRIAREIHPDAVMPQQPAAHAQNKAAFQTVLRIYQWTKEDAAAAAADCDQEAMTNAFRRPMDIIGKSRGPIHIPAALTAHQWMHLSQQPKMLKSICEYRLLDICHRVVPASSTSSSSSDIQKLLHRRRQQLDAESMHHKQKNTTDIDVRRIFEEAMEEQDATSSSPRHADLEAMFEFYRTKSNRIYFSNALSTEQRLEVMLRFWHARQHVLKWMSPSPLVFVPESETDPYSWNKDGRLRVPNNFDIIKLKTALTNKVDFTVHQDYSWFAYLHEKKCQR